MDMSSAKALGLHHMTAISGPAQDNVDFYTGVLGLRLLKLTVNFDDPTAYHLYYGDGLGTPGSILTFFPYPSGRRGVVGNGMVGVTSLSIPHDATGFWRERLKDNHVPFDEPTSSGDEEVLRFWAPDGLPMELVSALEFRPGKPWRDMPIEGRWAIGGMRSVTLFAEHAPATAGVLQSVLGLALESEEPDLIRFKAPDGSRVRIQARAGDPGGSGGHGTVHHIAFRAENEEVQQALQRRAAEAGLHPSPVMDRNYFKSIYFREPGHILFEVATDLPGFCVDESEEELGKSLQLPPQYEAYREQIEGALPPLRVPRR